MKKILSFLAICSFLSLSSCDFVRKLAGLPTSTDIAIKEKLIEVHEKAVLDSVNAAAAARETALKDSLAMVDSLASQRLRISYVFRFGEPVIPLQFRYNLIVGVYTQKTEAAKQFNNLLRKGYEPQFIVFPGGEHAVCLSSSDDVTEVERILNDAIAARDCPKDSWVFVNQ